MSKLPTITHSVDRRSGRGRVYRKILTFHSGDSRIKFIHSDDVQSQEEAFKVFCVNKEEIDLNNSFEFIKYCLRLSRDKSGELMFNNHIISLYDYPSGIDALSVEDDEIYVKYCSEFYYLQELLAD